MTCFFDHLKTNTGIIPPDFNQGVDVCISQKALLNDLNRHEKTVFEQLAERASLWRFLHYVQRTQLSTNLRQETKTDADRNARLKLLKETLWMATLLEELHRRLNEQSTAESFCIEQHTLRQLLHTYDETKALETGIDLPDPTHNISDDFEHFHRWFTYNFDSIRLFAGYLRRMCVGLLAAPEVFDYPYFWINIYVEAMKPLLNFASLWVYLPRTFSNLVKITEHLCENNTLIDLKHRITAHCEINDRLFNLVNDAPSVIAALLALFVLSGSALSLVVYITVSVKFAEVVFASIRAYVEVARLDALHDSYHTFNIQTLEDTDYLEHLDRCIAHEKDRFIVTAIMHGLLLLCLIAFTPPVLAISPWVPIAAALSAMLTLCLRFNNVRDVWIHERPHDDLQILPKEPSETEETGLTCSVAPVSI